MTDFEPVIGLEVHAQLKTRTKIFCSCEVRFGAVPNELTCPVCLGMPGALPVLNRLAVTLALRLALAVGCTIRPRSVFARKNYFYPDLPKGYQISQFDQPLAEHGRLFVEVDGRSREIGIRRVHMEEDAGKLVHEGPQAAADSSLVDFNRAGVPLVEIVGEPELRSPEEAYDYLTRLRSLLTYTDVCDGNMEEGSLRCDANVSIRPRGSTGFGTRVELKNLNSFRNVERALTYEIAWQSEILGNGGRVEQETKLYDADAHRTRLMRSKEEAHDYRYFPDPDLLPLVVAREWIEEVRASLPELPAERKERFVRVYGLGEAEAHLLTVEKPLANYFEAAVFGGETPGYAAATASGAARAPAAPPREVAKRVLRELMTKMKEEGLSAEELHLRYPARYVTELVRLQEAGAVSGPSAAEVFEFSWAWSAGDAGREADPVGSSHSFTIAGFGRRKPTSLEVAPGTTVGQALADAGLSADGFILGLDGRRVTDPGVVVRPGGILVGAPAVKGAGAVPPSPAASPETIVRAFGLGQISDERAIREAVEAAIRSNPKQLEQYRNGKEALFGYFVGQVMKAMGGRANPTVVNDLLKECLARME